MSLLPDMPMVLKYDNKAILKHQKTKGFVDN